MSGGEETRGRRFPREVLWEPGDLYPRKLWSYSLCTRLLIMLELEIQLKPNGCWQPGSPLALSLSCHLELPASPRTASSSLLVDPGSSRAGKDGEKLTYFRARLSRIQCQANYVLLGICYVAHIFPGTCIHVISSYGIGTITLIFQIRRFKFSLDWRSGANRGTGRDFQVLLCFHGIHKGCHPVSSDHGLWHYCTELGEWWFR